MMPADTINSGSALDSSQYLRVRTAFVLVPFPFVYIEPDLSRPCNDTLASGAVVDVKPDVDELPTGQNRQTDLKADERDNDEKLNTRAIVRLVRLDLARLVVLFHCNFQSNFPSLGLHNAYLLI